MLYTSLLDLPPELIALIYLYRYSVEESQPHYPSKQAFISSPPEIRISATALLRLARWCGQQAQSNNSAGKHEQGGSICQRTSPPRQATDPPELATTVPLEQLWTRIPPNRRRRLLGQLTRIHSAAGFFQEGATR